MCFVFSMQETVEIHRKYMFGILCVTHQNLIHYIFLILNTKPEETTRRKSSKPSVLIFHNFTLK